MTDAPELGRVTDRRPPFKYSALTRVWFSDTDAQGVVYYGRYLPYFDHARTEYHRHLGGFTTTGCEFVMRASAVEYHAPARFDDLIEAFVRVSRIGRTSVTYECAAYRLPDDTLMVTATADARSHRSESRRPTPVPGRAAICRSAHSSEATSTSDRAIGRRDRAHPRGDGGRRRRPARDGRSARRRPGDRVGRDRASSRTASSSSARRPEVRTRPGGCSVPIVFQGAVVGELRADGDPTARSSSGSRRSSLRTS